jgi:putative ABC transport system permease protein
MIKLSNVSKYYNSNDVIALGLRKVNLELNVNEFVAIVGESGSGKTTLLNVISGIDTYEDGEMYINGEETSYYSVNDMENYRKKYIAFVFQDYNLIDSYTVLQNVEAPLLLSGYPKEKIRNRALEIIKKVGLEKHIKHKATKLSGGQKQRVVIARALAKDCPIIAADEPTGNLDSKSAKQIIELLADIAKDRLVIMVTHDFTQVQDYATRKIRIYDGEVVEDKELSKVEKKNLPKLGDKEYKMDLSSTLKLSLRNLLAVPKKTFLMILVFTFFSIFIGLAYGGYILSMQETSYSYNSHFNYTNPDRIVIRKNDNTPFVTADYDELSDFSKVKDIVRKDYILDHSLMMSSNSGDIDFVNVEFLPLSSLSEELDFLYGTLPSKSQEVVVAANDELLDLAEELIGQELTGSYEWYQDLTVYEIAGVIDNDIIPGTDNFNTNYFFVTDERWEELARSVYLRSTGAVTINYSTLPFEGGLLEITDDLFVVDNSLDDLEIKANANRYNKIDCLTDTCEYDAKLRIIDYYIDEEYEIDFILDEDVLTNNIYLNQSTYDLIFYDEIYQVSVLTTDEINVDGLVKDIARIREGLNFKYKVIYPYDSNFSNEYEGLLLLIQNIGMISLIFFTLTGSTLITYVIFKMIINTKLHDYAIFRTIGANRNVIKTFIYVENLYIVIIAFIVFLIASLSIPNNLPTYSVFTAFKVFDTGKYIVYLILLIVMSLIISRKYCNKIFSSSVSKTLKTDLG